jgi:hypothetical protein
MYTMAIEVPSPITTAITRAMSDVSRVPTIIARPPNGPAGDDHAEPVKSVPVWCNHVGSELQKIVPTNPTLTTAKTPAAASNT